MKTFNISSKFVNELQELPIKVSLLINGETLWSEDVLTEQSFELAYNDEIKTENSIVLRFEGKTNVNTQTQLTCEYLKINNYNIGYLLESQSMFYHNFNQAGEWNQTMMFGDVIGIDGELRFNLDTPVAFWLAKHEKW